MESRSSRVIILLKEEAGWELKTTINFNFDNSPYFSMDYVIEF